MLGKCKLITKPLSDCYSVLTGFRNTLYDKGVLSSYKSSLPVISVGNLTVGGNGKTPLVCLIVKELERKGRRPVVILRGYGGKAKAPKLVLETESPREVGDEALLLKSKLRAPVVVSADRSAGARFVEDNNIGDVIVLDDGFQHRAIRRDLDILAINVDSDAAIESFILGDLLPFGSFREDRDRGALRADAFVLMRRGRGVLLSETLLSSLRGLLPSEKKVFEAGIDAAEFFDSAGNTCSELPGKVVAFSGIANPTGFVETVQSFGCQVAHHFTYRDHHQFKSSDLADMKEKFPGHSFVCTAKDYTKLKTLDREDLRDIYYIELQYKVEPEILFTRLLENCLE